MTTPTLEHHLIQTNGITLHVVMAGPVDGPVVVLLHGFPEFWFGWRAQIAALAAAGFRVWAPDQRGYNLSDKPKGVAAYGLDALAADVTGLLDAEGQERVYLAGHDWGGVVAWAVALNTPQRLRSLVILNAPHPGIAARHLTTNPRQMVRSIYAMFFQLPWLPERLLGLFNWRATAQAMRRSSRPGTFSDEELVEYRRAWSQPGAMRAMLNWYRAAREELARQRPARVTVPTTVIWGRRDVALRNELAEDSVALCDRGELIWLPDHTHWVQHEAADRVNDILLGLFTE